ncbi:flavodoxin domain-containing protein [Neobacillus sp. PS3-40]|uniref:flavodoxin domain-containing protein n=1 Tax=Neobacillus sp. PS3-40 TaxID=3070679 RepID=UPI0027E13FF4|nr:flavodoxin domain-containing protein [Neobacillus sp. PS3-40]WML42880.1 flavodoxin domain-containing protein [Neobacillus sp. PS3-40]
MKTVILYATKYGSVEHAVEILESKLVGKVQHLNIMKEDVPTLIDYDQVIIGGSIYVGKIQRKLSKFVTKNLPLLLTKRIGLFICAGEKLQEVREKELVDAFPNDLFNHAICKDIFGYEIHYEKLNFLEKKMVGAVLGLKEGCSELSEEKITDFAKIMSS